MRLGVRVVAVVAAAAGRREAVPVQIHAVQAVAVLVDPVPHHVHRAGEDRRVFGRAVVGVDGAVAVEVVDRVRCVDCDDADASVTPEDGDQDGATPCDDVPDCDDTDASLNPWDVDDDGSSTCDGDCADDDPDVGPDVVDVCGDCLDTDCGGDLDADCDDDGDGYAECRGDCDDTNDWIHPRAGELCDDVDNDCSGIVDDECVTCAWSLPSDELSIQAAIDLAEVDDVLCLEPGQHSAQVRIEGTAVHLLGTKGPQYTVLEGNGSSSVIEIEGVSAGTPSVRGLTITGGQGQYWGGGLYVLDSPVTVEHSVVTGNGSTDVGGGITVRETGGVYDIVLRDVEVTANSSRSSGGADLRSNSTMTIEDVLVTGNYASAFTGGIALHGATCDVRNLRVLDNHAAWNGGGAYIEGISGTLDQVDVSGNSAGWHSGGIWWTGSSGATLSHARVTDNSAGTEGGGIYASGGGEFLGVVIAGNSATSGGGLYASGSGAPLLLGSVVVHGNTATDGGGGIAVTGSGVDLVDSAISDNEALSGGGLLVSDDGLAIAYSNLWGNLPEGVVGTPDPVGADGNLSVDPGFMGPATPGWDLRLQVTSPLIDVGDPETSDPDASPADIGAFGGPVGGTWDLDGDGYPAWWQPGPYDAETGPADGWDCDDQEPTRYPGQGC